MPYGGGGLVSNGDLMFAYSEMDDKTMRLLAPSTRGCGTNTSFHPTFQTNTKAKMVQLR